MPVTPAVTASSESLRTELAEARDAARHLAAASLLVADELEATGTPPNDDWFSRYEAIVQRITGLIDLVRQACVERGMAEGNLPPGDLSLLEQRLDEIEAIDARRAEAERARDQVMLLARGIESLRHTDDAGFAPLVAARAEAAALRGQCDVRSSGESPDWSVNDWGETNPLAALARLVAAPDSLDDARWARLQDAVTSAFGRTMAAAVARGRIVMDDGVRQQILEAFSLQDAQETGEGP